jgi:hypothetical protein
MDTDPTSSSSPIWRSAAPGHASGAKWIGLEEPVRHGRREAPSMLLNRRPRMAVRVRGCWRWAPSSASFRGRPTACTSGISSRPARRRSRAGDVPQ